jgi:hypothetical protein
MGTPSYMSPEQCRGAGAVDTRADIYSLGCILFKMVCGCAPFVGEGAGDIIGAHLHVPPPDLQSLAPGVPPGLAALVARMLAKKPEARPQTMAVVSQALDELQRALGGLPARLSTPLPMPSPGAPLPVPSLPPPGREATPLPVPALAMSPPMSSPATPLPGRDAPPLPARARISSPGSQSSTTLGGSAGMSSGQGRAGTRRLPFLFGGVVALGTVAAIAIVLAAGGDSEPQGQQVSFGELADAPPSTDAAVAVAVAVDAAVAPPPTTVVTAEDTAAVVMDDELEAECRGFQVDRKWAELEQCAEKLLPLAPERAAELKAVALEARSAARIAAIEAALRGKNLRHAKTELEQVWPEAAGYAKIKVKYAAAETQAIADLAVELDRVKDSDCEEYQELLAKTKAAQPSRVAAEAALKTSCTPTKCDADALVQKAKDELDKRRYAAALDLYDAAIRCRPDHYLVRRAFDIACNNHAVARAKAYWKRLSVPARAEAKVSCIRNGITEAELSAP